MFRAFLHTLLLAAVLLSSPVRAADVAYATAIEDLPLMAGMQELPEGIITFDTPQGRIVETSALTRAASMEVEAFYGAALPPLGWTPAGPLAYARAGEKLTLHIERAEEGTLVRFSLAPQTGK